MSPSSPYRKGVAPITSPRGLKAGCLRDPRGNLVPLPLSGKASNKSSIVRRCAGKCAPTPPSTHTHTKSNFNMRTRSSAKSSAEQGPESTQGLTIDADDHIWAMADATNTTREPEATLS